MNPVVEAVRQKYPGVYDDLTDDQLTLALGQKADGAYDDIKTFSDDYTRVSRGMGVGEMMLSQSEFEQQAQGPEPVELPLFGKPGTFTRGLSKALTGTVAGATSPSGIATGAALMVPVVGPVLGVGLSAAAVWEASKKAQEAIETGSPEAAGEAVGMGGLGAAGTLLGLRAPKPRQGIPPRPSPLPIAAAQVSKEFKPSFTVGLPEEPPTTAAVETKSISAGEPVKPAPAKAPVTRESIASRILQKAGLDPTTADRFAGLVSGRAASQSLEAFRNDLLTKFRESGLQFPSQISMYRTEPSYYEAMGFSPEQVAEHVRNAEIANRKSVQDVQAANRRILEQLESGKGVVPKPEIPMARAPGTTTELAQPRELSQEEAQSLFLDKATAEDNAAIEENKPPPPSTGAAPETQAPTAATVSEARPGGVAAPGEPPALISQATTEGQKPQAGVTEPSTASPAEPPPKWPNKGPGSPAGAFGEIYGPTLSKEAQARFAKQSGEEFDLPAPEGTKLTLKVKSEGLLWLEASRRVGKNQDEVGIAYMRVRPNGDTVLDASHHGRPIDKLAVDTLSDFLSKTGGEKAAKPGETPTFPAPAEPTPAPSAKTGPKMEGPMRKEDIPDIIGKDPITGTVWERRGPAVGGKGAPVVEWMDQYNSKFGQAIPQFVKENPRGESEGLIQYRERIRESVPVSESDVPLLQKIIDGLEHNRKLLDQDIATERSSKTRKLLGFDRDGVNGFIASYKKELARVQEKLKSQAKTEPPEQGPGIPRGEIRPGPNPYDPSAGAMGIRPPLSQFMRDDVIPAVQTVVGGITETLEGLRNLLSPVSAGPLARLGAGIIREHAARLAQKDVQMRAKFSAAHKAMAKLDKPATLDWLDAVEGGARSTLTGPLRVFADEARAALDQRLRQVQALGTGKLQHFIQDYFPHLWKRPDNALNWLQRIFGKRPLRGPASFLKHRTIPTTREGVDAGLEPVSWNPMDILLAKLHEMDRYIMGQKIFQEFKDKGLAKFSRSDIPPQGYAKIDDRIGNVIEYRPTTTVSGAPGAPERILRGHWFVQQQAARVLNNYLSPGLERYAWYKALRWVGNNMNMATLGLSGYHGMFTMIDAGTSKLALGIEQASRGQPIAAATIPRGLLGTLAANQVEAFIKGSKVLQEYTKPGSVGGEYSRIVDGLIAAGGRVQMPEIYQNSTLKNFMNAIRKGNYTGAVLRGPAAALHAFAYPLMNVVVPRLKLGVFFDMARMELERLGPTATRDEVREVLGKVWDSVDNRMGELVYDNLFWNKVLKDLLFLAIRSVGWNLGTLRELGGGLLDSATVIKRLKNGDPFLTRRMAYTIALPFTVGLMAALYQYLRTGKLPEELRDYRDPKTGNTLPDGQPERVNFPSYLKDVESVKRHPVQTAINKAHPMWGTIADMLQNKDYYGTEIIHPGDPLVRKVADELKFIAKSFVPYGISGAEKRGKIESGILPKVESFFGIMPVPAELTRTPAENLAIELIGRKPKATRTKAEFERSQKERDAIQQIKMGKLTLKDAQSQGLVEPNRVKEVQKRIRTGYLQYAMKRLSIDELFDVLEKANPKERALILPELRAKIIRSKTITAKEKQAYFEMLKQRK